MLGSLRDRRERSWLNLARPNEPGNDRQAQRPQGRDASAPAAGANVPRGATTPGTMTAQSMTTSAPSKPPKPQSSVQTDMKSIAA